MSVCKKRLWNMHLRVERTILPTRRSFLFFVLFVLGIFSILAGLYWKALISPLAYGSLVREVSVSIPENTNCSGIGRMLYQNGLSRGPDVISIYARLHGVDQQLKPGPYLFKTSLSLPEIVHSLVAGPSDMLAFTMPEGYSLDQLTELLVQKGLVNREEFRGSLARHLKSGSEFINKIPPGGGLEGYLFPDTYYAGYKTGEDRIVTMMLDRFLEEMKNLDYEKKVAERNLTLHQAVTIASMIEGEAAVDTERPLIAGVIFNRLSLGMPLQIDATVKYALGGQKKIIYYKDLEVDSPYNTYRVTGLPPGPINSPGRESLLAAVNPARTDYLYYVAKPDGTHAFSSNLEEHNSNKSKYQQ